MKIMCSLSHSLLRSFFVSSSAASVCAFLLLLYHSLRKDYSFSVAYFFLSFFLFLTLSTQKTHTRVVFFLNRHRRESSTQHTWCIHCCVYTQAFILHPHRHTHTHTWYYFASPVMLSKAVSVWWYHSAESRKRSTLLPLHPSCTHSILAGSAYSSTATNPWVVLFLF